MTPSLLWKIVRIALTGFYLFCGWILFTGTFAPFSVIIGLIFSAALSLLTYSIFIEQSEAARRYHLPRIHYLIIFALVLMYEVFTASFRVAYFVISNTMHPRIVHFRTRLRYDFAKTLLANAITLTPGTVTLELDDDHLVVHWLNAKTAHSHYAGQLIKGRFESLLKRIWS